MKPLAYFAFKTLFYNRKHHFVYLKFPNLQPQSPLRSYPVEAIGSLSCTKDGLYLAGGALSGNAYLWEVSKYSIKFPCSEVLVKRYYFLVRSNKIKSVSYDKFLSMSLEIQKNSITVEVACCDWCIIKVVSMVSSCQSDGAPITTCYKS